MKIKHWQGYGNVSAQRIKDSDCTLHVKVTGNHEWGLVRTDAYDLFNWLVKRFDKTQASFVSWKSHLRNVRFEIGDTIIDGLDVDTCDYYFDYAKED